MWIAWVAGAVGLLVLARLALRLVPGFRWSLYVLKDRRLLCLAMHSHNLGDLLGYAGSLLAESGDPRNGFSFALNFNRNHTAVHISAIDFTDDGNPKRELLVRLKEVDPDWMGQAHVATEWQNPSTRRDVESGQVLDLLYGRAA